MRLRFKVVSLTVSFALFCTSVSAQDADRKLVRGVLYDKIISDVDTSKPSLVPLSVLRALIDQHLQNDQSWRNLRASGVGHTPYRKLDASEALIEELEHQVSVSREQIIAQTFAGFSTSPAFALDRNLIPGDRSLADLQQRLQIVASAELQSLKTLQSSVVPVKVAAIKAVLADLGSTDTATPMLKKAEDATAEIRRLIQKPTLEDIDLATLRKQGRIVLEVFNDKARKALGELPTTQSAAKAFYQQLADISTLVTTPVTVNKGLAAPKLSALTPELSVQLLVSLDSMHGAEALLSQTLNKQGQVLADGLQDGVGALSSRWNQLAYAAGKISPELIKDNQLPDQVRNLAPFIRDFDSLNDVLTGSEPVGVPQLSKALSAVGILPHGTALVQASDALSEIMTAKGSYTTAATGLISSLTALNSAGIPIPGIQQLAPVLTTANTILKAAGPLATIAGFASGLSAFSAIGGLGGLGGGGDDAVGAALSQINAKLDQINNTLKTVISKLDALSDQITKDHLQVMNALEAIEFDVARTNVLITNEMHNTVRSPCLRSSAPTEQYLAEQLKKCDDALADIYVTDTPLSTPPFQLTFETNLRSYNLGKNALTEFTDELTFRQNLTNLLSNTDCEGLAYPSADLDNLQYKIDEYGKSTTPRSCSALLQSSLIEPGILRQYIKWEQTAFAATPRLGQKEAIRWWQTGGPKIRDRWVSKELPLLNLAIAQQAGISGDVLIGELSEILDQSLTDDSKRASLKQVWKDKGVLPDNVSRYWMWSKIRTRTLENANDQPVGKPKREEIGPWVRTLYAFAWESGDDSYWYLLTGASRKNVHFNRVPTTRTGLDGKQISEMIWEVTFSDLDPVQMPKPTEMNLLELRWPSTLTQVVEARNLLLDALASMDVVNLSNASKKDAIQNVLEGYLVSSASK